MSELDLSSSAIITNTSESIDNFQSLLDIKYLIDHFETYYDLDSSVVAHIYNDLMSGSAHIEPMHKDLTSTGFRPFESFLDSNAQIPASNLLDVVFKLVQAPVVIATCLDVQDSYIRQSRDTLNYGTNTSITFGDNIDGVYRGMIQFDITNFTTLKDANILSANLVMYLDGVVPTDAIIDIYEINVAWQENSVTWSNFNATLTTSLYTPTIVNNILKVNMLDYLNTRKALGLTTVNILIKVRDENTNDMFYARSKENGDPTKNPCIQIAYQDMNWTGFTDLKDLPSTAFLRTRNARDLFSHVVVAIACTTDLDGQAIFKVTTKTDITSTIKVKMDTYIELASKSKLYIKSEFSGNAIIRDTKSLDLTSSSKTYKSSDVPGTAITVSHFAWLPSNAVIRNTTKNDLNSKSNLYLSTVINSNAIIKNYKNSDLQSKSTLSYGVGLDSYAILGKLSLELESNVMILNQIDLDGSTDVYFKLDLESNGIIRRNENLELNDSAILRQSDIIELNSNAYMVSDIAVVSLYSIVIVKARKLEYLDSLAVIKTGARRWIPNIHGVEIFKYEDRKLPRVWKKELFIP